MLSPRLAKLLVLQDRDGKRLDLEAQLKAIPRDTAVVEQKISAERAAIDGARAELKGLETKKKLLESEIGAAEQKLSKYKTQQMAVRKNDEFQALGHEIEETQATIEGFEEQELGVMYSIDEAKKKFTASEALMKTNIVGYEEKIRGFKQREANLAAELKTAQADLAQAREPLDEPTLRIYDRLAPRHRVVCVAIRSGKCTGCHLKVSSDIESAARKIDELAFCDQCGRIVYWES